MRGNARERVQMRKDKEQMKGARRQRRLSANEGVDGVLFEWVLVFLGGYKCFMGDMEGS